MYHDTFCRCHRCTPRVPADGPDKSRVLFYVIVACFAFWILFWAVLVARQ